MWAGNFQQARLSRHVPGRSAGGCKLRRRWATYSVSCTGIQ